MKYLFVGGHWHGRFEEAAPPAWKVARPGYGVDLYQVHRWASEPDGRLSIVEIMVHGEPSAEKVTGAMAMAWMREHGRVME